MWLYDAIQDSWWVYDRCSELLERHKHLSFLHVQVISAIYLNQWRHHVLILILRTVRTLSVQARMSRSPYAGRSGGGTRNRGRTSLRYAALSLKRLSCHSSDWGVQLTYNNSLVTRWWYDVNWLLCSSLFFYSLPLTALSAPSVSGLKRYRQGCLSAMDPSDHSWYERTGQ